MAYVRQVANAVKPGGHVIVSTFGPEGPTKCSGLDVVRYDAEKLHGEFGAHFRLLDSSKELHGTPPFWYCPAISLLLLQGRIEVKRSLLVAASPRAYPVKSFFGNDGDHDQPGEWVSPRGKTQSRLAVPVANFQSKRPSEMSSAINSSVKVAE